MTSRAGQENKTVRLKGMRTGLVDRAGLNKTRRVTIEYQIKHPKYNKYVKRRSNLTVHDESNVSGVGDRVAIIPCRPLSKTKRWKVVSVLEKAVGAIRLHDETAGTS